MRITVVGCGRWGSFLAWYVDRLGHQTRLFGREGSAHMLAFRETRTNGLITLPPSVELVGDLAAPSDAILISIDSQGLRRMLTQNAQAFRGVPLVLCMKGLEIGTGKRLTEVVADVLGPEQPVAVWIGPGHVQEFTRGVPNCMVIDSADEALKAELVDAFSGDLIRFYYGRDLIGNEIGAAAKNVVGIAAGALDGVGLGTLKGALMSRGTREVARLIAAMGGNELSAYGLCHLGDYEATVFSPYSHNRRFGECVVTGQPYTELAEGYFTVKALLDLEAKTGVELPISRAVYQVLYEGVPARETVDGLFRRTQKMEF
ncbi:MAG TPA: NAD(P)H-dependent glycerol-3-phosphate dehydrogenase [Candidatus Limiplasma sp.]|nr:NAD(P)H-dependent glycerol-3-phosphate dehydrogenase [Candidatus Limiplasma sp.]HPS80385.1 NAD(P)H-dependent glycerol-3-phosphate dehydrogenase [Candidatus Limiplasma sp.]